MPLPDETARDFDQVRIYRPGGWRAIRQIVWRLSPLELVPEGQRELVEQPALILFVSDDQPNNQCCHRVFAALCQLLVTLQRLSLTMRVRLYCREQLLDGNAVWLGFVEHGKIPVRLD